MKNRLKKITESLLYDDNSHGRLLDLCKDLQSLFEQISCLDIDSNESRENIKLSSGTAIGTTWAAMCIQDFVRTKRFLKAIYQAINDMLETKMGAPIQILYAGCGPFATLLTPLLTIFNKDQIQCTLLEINPLSILMLNKIIETLEVESCIKEIINIDATKYVIDQNNVPDIFICETLQAALRKEPQVAIYLQLGPQVNEKTIFIPEQIDIHCGLLNASLDHKRMIGELDEGYSSFLILKPLLKLNKYTYKILPHSEGLPGKQLFAAEAQLPNDLDGFDRVCIFTKIKLYQDIELDYWESPLTIPIQYSGLRTEQAGTGLNILYELGEEPEFKITFL
jgi:predicted RNA methylase